MYNESMSFEQVVGTLLPYVIGGVVGIAGTYATGFAKEFFDERARKRRHRLDVAREAHKIVNEAITTRFQSEPRDLEHAYSVAVDVRGVDKEYGDKFYNLLGNWKVFALKPDYQGKSERENIASRNKHFERLINSAFELQSWSSRIRS